MCIALQHTVQRYMYKVSYMYMAKPFEMNANDQARLELCINNELLLR